MLHIHYPSFPWTGHCLLLLIVHGTKKWPQPCGQQWCRMVSFCFCFRRGRWTTQHHVCNVFVASSFTTTKESPILTIVTLKSWRHWRQRTTTIVCIVRIDVVVIVFLRSMVHFLIFLIFLISFGWWPGQYQPFFFVRYTGRSLLLVFVVCCTSSAPVSIVSRARRGGSLLLFLLSSLACFFQGIGCSGSSMLRSFALIVDHTIKIMLWNRR